MSQPVRRTHKREVTHDPVSGEERTFDEQFEADVYGPQGSIDTTSTHTRVPCDCGCYAPVEGYCAVCGAISCQRHHGICLDCGKSICLEHSVFMPDANGGVIRLCKRHARRRRAAVVYRAVLAPFIRFES